MLLSRKPPGLIQSIPKGRGRKPQPATLSMFEWAPSREQEREAKPVSAGRWSATHGGRAPR